MSPSSPPKIEKSLLAVVREWETRMWRSIILGLVAMVAWQGKNMANDFIVENSAVVAAQKAVLEAKADAAARKADDSLADETRIFHAVEQMQVTQHETTVSLTGLTQHVTDLEHQVDRIEKKQDNTLQN